MSRRYLYGPVDQDFADQNLITARQEGYCLTFHSRPGEADLAIAPGDTWAAVAARFPDGWHPDFVALNLSYTHVPKGLWAAPVPLVGLAGDWPWNFHWFRHALPFVDAVLTDTPGVAVFRRLSYAHAWPANFFGAGRAFLEEADTADPASDRDLDVVFVGNLHHAVQGARLPWLGRLAGLADRYRVVIASGVFGEDYRALLRRAKIVFNRSARGECNRRVFEALCCGALLFQEAGNAEVPAILRHGAEYVAYGGDNLERLLAHYLVHDEERRAIAAAGQAKARQCGFAALWQEALDRLAPAWPEVEVRARQRVAFGGTGPGLVARAWQTLGGVADPFLADDLAAALRGQPDHAGFHNALGVAVAGVGGPVTAREAVQAAAHFRQALDADPDYLPAGLNLAFALVALGEAPAAAERARQMLLLLHRPPTFPEEGGEAVFFPPSFDTFRVEWERAAWAHAGHPADEAHAKHALLGWRLHELLGELTGELVPFHEATLARPDLPATRGALGCALARAGRLAEAMPHLRAAVAGNPFDLAAARALYQTLHELGDADGQRAVARDCRLLAHAAPGVVAAEPWFAAAPPAGDELASIIIPCCNEVDFTRRCLESVLAHTRPPYELIVVDNDSTDQTPALLAALQARPEPARVAVLRNATNRGFPAACNQGLAEAQGRYLVLLNNDTVVECLEPWRPAPAPLPPPTEVPPPGIQVEVRPGTPLVRPYQGRVSLCLIVKDEEANLADCLRSAAELADEVIVVDTGSTDRTREIAAQFGARVFDFAWVDSFAAARNECLRHATGDWIFWLDADDRLDDENRARLRALFAALQDENVAYVMRCRCLPDLDSGVATTVDHVRLFRNDPKIRWRHRVHEQILPAVRSTGGSVRRADVVVQHTGYLDRALRRRKLERDLRLLRLELGEQPDHPFTLFNLGNVLQDLGHLREALDAYRRSLSGSDPSDSIVRKLYASLADGHRRLGEWDQAVTACQQGRQFYPEDVELLTQEGLARRGRGDVEGAIACWRRALERRDEPDHFASVADGLGSYRTRHYLAELFRDQGRPAEAEAAWRAALADNGAFTPAWLGLGAMYVQQQRWPDLDGVIAHLAADPATADEATLLRAERHLAEGAFAAARELVEGVIGRKPQAVWPRELLSHALIQEGADWGAAERALRDVLALDPGNAGARQNLAVLLRQQGRAGD